MDHLDGPPVAFNHIAVANRNRWHKVSVGALTLEFIWRVLPDLLELVLFLFGEVLVEADVVQRVGLGHRSVGAKAIGRRVCSCHELRDTGGVVGMGMGDEDVGHPLIGTERAEYGIEVFVKGGPGVDDGHLSPADDVDPGAGKGERIGVLGDDPTYQWRQFIDLAVVGCEIGVECYGHAREVLLGRGDR